MSKEQVTQVFTLIQHWAQLCAPKDASSQWDHPRSGVLPISHSCRPRRVISMSSIDRHWLNMLSLDPIMSPRRGLQLPRSNNISVALSVPLHHSYVWPGPMSPVLPVHHKWVQGTECNNILNIALRFFSCCEINGRQNKFYFQNEWLNNVILSKDRHLLWCTSVYIWRIG